MADPVAAVEKIVKLGLAIKDAVDMVRHNGEECNEIRRRVLRFSAILSQLQQAGMMNGSPAMSGALEDLEETLERALELVTACQVKSTIRRLIKAADLSKQLRRVQDDILNKVMLASFAINAHTTIVLLTIQARQPEDTILMETSHNNHSTDDSRSELNGKDNIALTRSEALIAPLVASRNFSLSELKAAINDRNIIGRGGSCIVYKGVLNDGNVVAIKKFERPHQLDWECTYHQLLLVSELQHKNVVKVLGFGHEVGSSSVMMRLLKRKNGQAKEREHFWVEEYVPNGSLHMITHYFAESRLDWSSIFRIIEGVAQGLQYLHEQHIVHMDVKPGNILLDFDMNPKIIDFELSKVLDGDETTENRVAGTYSYLPPEYALYGVVSKKNDVYAFGATLLEAVSGICRLEPFRRHPLHKWAWEAWEAGRLEEMFDPSLFDGSQLMEINRCVQVGLLCVQFNRADRPTMADVLQMLRSLKELPTPKTPAYMESDEEPAYMDEGPASPAAWSDGTCSPR